MVGNNGPDGADQAILAAVDLDRIAQRYQRIVIASGDAAFTWVAQSLRDRGLLVYNVTRTRASQSRRLREACHVSLHLSETGPHVYGGMTLRALSQSGRIRRVAQSRA